MRDKYSLYVLIREVMNSVNMHKELVLCQVINKCAWNVILL